MTEILENVSGCEYVYITPNIPMDKMNGALSSYVTDAKAKDIIMLCDETVFGSAKDGIVMTNDYLYIKESFNDSHKISLKDIKNIKIKGLIQSVLYINDRKIASFTTLSKDTMRTLARMLEKYVSSLDEITKSLEELGNNKIDEELEYTEESCTLSTISYYFNDIHEGDIIACKPLDFIKALGASIEPLQEVGYYNCIFNGIRYSESSKLDKIRISQPNALIIPIINEIILELKEILDKMFERYCYGYELVELSTINPKYDLMPQINTLDEQLEYIQSSKFRNEVVAINKEGKSSWASKGANLGAIGLTNSLTEKMTGRDVVAPVRSGNLFTAGLFGLMGAAVDAVSNAVTNNSMTTSFAQIPNILSCTRFAVDALRRIEQSSNKAITFILIVEDSGDTI